MVQTQIFKTLRYLFISLSTAFVTNFSSYRFHLLWPNALLIQLAPAVFRSASTSWRSVAWRLGLRLISCPSDAAELTHRFPSYACRDLFRCPLPDEHARPGASVERSQQVWSELTSNRPRGSQCKTMNEFTTAGARKGYNPTKNYLPYLMKFSDNISIINFNMAYLKVQQ